MTQFYFDFRAGESICRDEEGAELSDMGAAHDEALGALPPSLREAFVMKHVEGRSYEEMAGWSASRFHPAGLRDSGIAVRAGDRAHAV